MKKLILAGVIGGASIVASANTPLTIQPGQPAPMYQAEQPIPYTYAQPSNALPTPNVSLSLEYLSHKAEFDEGVDADLDGFAIGFSTTPQRHGLWTKFEFLSNSEFDADYYEFSFGGHLNFFNTDRFYATGTIGAGVGLIDVSGFDETVYFTFTRPARRFMLRPTKTKRTKFFLAFCESHCTILNHKQFCKDTVNNHSCPTSYRDWETDRKSVV